MNNNICQFYVIFGNRNFKTESNNNVYINATDIHDLKELSEKILNEYKSKAKQGVKVGSEIIFLIPNERYKTYTEDVIKKLKVNGKIELMQSPKVATPKVELPKEDLTKVKTEKKITTPSVDPVQSTIKKEETKEKTNTNQINTTQVSKEKEQKAPVYKPSDNIYRGTINNSTYNNFQKPKKSNKVPIIIFIISFIFFIVSLILLLFA